MATSNTVQIVMKSAKAKKTYIKNTFGKDTVKDLTIKEKATYTKWVRTVDTPLSEPTVEDSEDEAEDENGSADTGKSEDDKSDSEYESSEAEDEGSEVEDEEATQPIVEDEVEQPPPPTVSAEVEALMEVRDKIGAKDKKIASYKDQEIMDVIAITGGNGQGGKTVNRADHTKTLTQRQLVIAEWIDKQIIVSANKEGGDKQKTTMRSSNMGSSMKIEKAFAEEIQNHYEGKFGYRYSQTAFNHMINGYVWKILGFGNARVRSGYTKYKVFGDKSKRAGEEDTDKIVGCDIPEEFWNDFMGGFMETEEAKKLLEIGEEPIRLARENRKGNKGVSSKKKAKLIQVDTIMDNIDTDNTDIDAIIAQLQKAKEAKAEKAGATKDE